MPPNTELFEPEAALNGGFLKKSTYIKQTTKTIKKYQNNSEVITQ